MNPSMRAKPTNDSGLMGLFKSIQLRGLNHASKDDAKLMLVFQDTSEGKNTDQDIRSEITNKVSASGFDLISITTRPDGTGGPGHERTVYVVRLRKG